VLPNARGRALAELRSVKRATEDLGGLAQRLKAQMGELLQSFSWSDEPLKTSEV
jgi:hypothetical protein